jgi:hypothetical protein
MATAENMIELYNIDLDNLEERIVMPKIDWSSVVKNFSI